MISQDGNTRDESKMRRPELKDRLQAAWDRIDALEAENERLRGAIDEAYGWLRKLQTHIEAPVDRQPQYSVERPQKHRQAMATLEEVLDGGGDQDE